MASADDGKSISRDDARTLIQRFQANNAYYIEDDPVKGIKGGVHGKNWIQSILKQNDCTGVRHYFGLNAANQLVVVLVGEDSKGNVLSDGVKVEEGPLCPPICGLSNPLDA